jgi:sugar porter (SP) family MFS transporter
MSTKLDCEFVEDTEIANANLEEIAHLVISSPWTKAKLKLYLVLSVVYFSSWQNGYDGTIMGTINGDPAYVSYYNFGETSSLEGVVQAIYSIGSYPSIFLAPVILDKFGRKQCLFLGCLLVIIGTCIQAPATSRGMFIAGRLILGFGSSFVSQPGNVYVAEMAHPNYRGTLTALNNVCYWLGSIVGSWSAFGASYSNTTLSFRLPIWLQLLGCVIMIAFVLFIPETPRYLMLKDRQKEAFDVLVKYHGENDPHHPLVQLEMAEMVKQISSQKQQPSWWNYAELFRTPSDRRRARCWLVMGWFGQYITPTGYYLPVMITLAGVKDRHTVLLINGLHPILSMMSSTIGSYLTDQIGRRPLLLFTCAAVSILFAVLTGLSKAAISDGNEKAGVASIVIILITTTTISLGWTPHQGTYVAETLTTHHRARGQCLQSFLGACAVTLLSYSSGPALGSISYYYYLVFVFWNAFMGVIIYFYWPETMGRTLEEMQEIFDDPNPVKKSLEPRITTEITA